MASEKEKRKSNNLRNSLILIILILSLSIISYFLFVNQNDNSQVQTQAQLVQDSTKIKKEQEKYEADFKNAVTSTEDTSVKVIISSSPLSDVPYTLDKNATKPVKRIYTGKRINIAVTGLDSRLGTRSNHADANHIISILLDSGFVEIVSVPRDTPADAGMPDSSGQNKLTVVRAGRGREAYLKELANIAGFDKIHYWVEGGFSQVMGLIEFFGFKDSKSTLQVLRSRVGLGGDDFQRCYNQGQFIRQMVLKHFNKFKGFTGEILIRGGLALLETNLTTTVIKDIIDKLERKSFPKSPEVISVRIKPPMYNQFKIYDFTNETVVQSLKNKIEKFNEGYVSDSARDRAVPAYILKSALSRAEKDSAKKPQNVITSLSTYFNQKAWLQVTNQVERAKIRRDFAYMLSNAYLKKKQPDKAKQVLETVRLEEELFNNRLK